MPPGCSRAVSHCGDTDSSNSEPGGISAGGQPGEAPTAIGGCTLEGDPTASHASLLPGPLSVHCPLRSCPSPPSPGAFLPISCCSSSPTLLPLKGQMAWRCLGSCERGQLRPWAAAPARPLPPPASIPAGQRPRGLRGGGVAEQQEGRAGLSVARGPGAAAQ